MEIANEYENWNSIFISRITKDDREQLTSKHLIECADYAQQIGVKFKLPNLCKLTGLLHDAGKLSPEFVEYLRKVHFLEKQGVKSNLKGSVIHSTQGAKYLYELIPVTCPSIYLALVREIAANCIANHHGSLMDGISPEGDTPLFDRLNEENEDLHYSKVVDNYKKVIHINAQIQELINKSVIEVTQFIQKCKFIGLNNAFMLSLLTKSVYSSLVDSDRINAYYYEINTHSCFDNHKPCWSDYYQRLEETLTLFKVDSDINLIRSSISEECLQASYRDKGIYRLDVPTGGGKTLSSLRYALNHAKIHNVEHIIYVIPYLSVIEQTAKEMKKALKYRSDDDFILEHHSNISPNENEENTQFQSLLTARWDSPIIITTMVQFLESVYSCKSGNIRKFHNMANSIIIFDEVQSLPLKCTHLFNELINYLHYCAECSILLCTATQPPLNETESAIKLSKQPELISDTSDMFMRLKRTCIINSTIPGGFTSKKLAKFVLEKYEKEGNCLIILNTKKDTTKLYNSLKELLNNIDNMKDNLTYLSTLMCPAHRLDVINRIKQNKHNHVLCVSTQLIEAGVDLSFACVIRAVAGLDSIAQAAGRCNRNGESPTAKNVYIVNIADENLSRLPDIKCGADITYKILEEAPEDLLAPSVMKRYYQEFYYKNKYQMDYIVKSINLYDILSKNAIGIGTYKNRNGMDCKVALRQAFRTAGDAFSVIDQQTESVFVPYSKGADLLKEYHTNNFKNVKPLIREMGKYMVSLFPNQIRELESENAITILNNGMKMLSINYYDNKMGVVFDHKMNLILF